MRRTMADCADAPLKRQQVGPLRVGNAVPFAPHALDDALPIGRLGTPPFTSPGVDLVFAAGAMDSLRGAPSVFLGGRHHAVLLPSGPGSCGGRSSPHSDSKKPARRMPAGWIGADGLIRTQFDVTISPYRGRPAPVNRAGCSSLFKLFVLAKNFRRQ